MASRKTLALLRHTPEAELAPPPPVVASDERVASVLSSLASDHRRLCASANLPAWTDLDDAVLRSVWLTAETEWGNKGKDRVRLYGSTRYLHCVARVKTWLRMLRTGRAQPEGLWCTDLLPTEHPFHAVRRQTFAEVHRAMKGDEPCRTAS